MLAVVARMMFVVLMPAMVMATVMVPGAKSLAAAKAEAAAEFIADNVPAGAVPAIVMPTVGIAVPLVFVVTPAAWATSARRHELRINFRQRQGGFRRLGRTLYDRCCP
jgi:cytochrome c oxidase assembly factor CtaG